MAAHDALATERAKRLLQIAEILRWASQKVRAVKGKA